MICYVSLLEKSGSFSCDQNEFSLIVLLMFSFLKKSRKNNISLINKKVVYQAEYWIKKEFLFIIYYFLFYILF